MELIVPKRKCQIQYKTQFGSGHWMSVSHCYKLIFIDNVVVLHEPIIDQDHSTFFSKIETNKKEEAKI